jgi:hypothetical protein
MYAFAKNIYHFIYYRFWKSNIYRPIVDRLTDYYVISFPKCGRTWLNFFLGEYFAEKYDTNKTLDFSGIIKPHYAVPRISFTHGPARPESIDQLKEFQAEMKDNNIIFLTRDPRDVVVSYYHQLNERRPYFGPDSFADVQAMSMSDFIRHDLYGVEWIVTYMNTWYAVRNQFADFLLLRYEDMHQKPDEAFQSVLRFIGEDVDGSILSKAIERSSFTNMRKVEKSGEVDDARLQPADTDNPDSYKVRKGKVGGYKEELSNDDIEYVDSVFADLHEDIRSSM